MKFKLLAKGFGEGFKEFSGKIAKLFNSLILAIVYFGGVGPVSIISKLFGKHFIELKSGRKSSYWRDHEPVSEDIEDYYKSF
jgi:hypothetical protein